MKDYLTTNSFMLIFVKFYYQRQNHYLNFFNIGPVIDSFPEKILFQWINSNFVQRIVDLNLQDTV